MRKVYVHFEGSEVVGVSSNPEVALRFIVSGENRIVKQFELETKIRKNGKLENKRGRKKKVTK